MLHIAIVTRQMIMGGVEKALIAMLKQFDYSNVKVDLYVQRTGGSLESHLPKEVKVYELHSLKPKDIFQHPVSVIKKYRTLRVLKREKITYLTQNHLSSNILNPIEKEYDIAIAYHAPNTVPIFFVIDKIKAKKKVLWLHGDLETNGGSVPEAIQYYEKYNQVFAVSKDVYSSFIKNCPNMKDRTLLFYNFVDVEGMNALSITGSTYQDEYSGFRILTIGRLHSQKGIDIAIHVCKQLIQDHYDVRWYVCGEGEEREQLQDLIKECDLEEQFILLGNQSNPYHYLKDCDLYVQPSRYEGYCTTTNEARLLNKPVITTNVSGAEEQFINNETGWIVPIEEDAIYEQIVWCIKNTNQVRQVQEQLKKSIQMEKTQPIDLLLDITKNI